MNKINWKIRLKNKTFWVTMIPALLLVAQQVASLFGISFSLTEKQGELLAIVNTIFIILTLIGVVSDPTVQGLCDSARAMEYEEPAPKA